MHSTSEHANRRRERDLRCTFTGLQSLQRIIHDSRLYYIVTHACTEDGAIGLGLDNVNTHIINASSSISQATQTI